MKKILITPLFILLTGCSSITVLNTHSSTGDKQAFLIWFSFGIMLIVLITVFILFARFVYKYRYTKEKDGFTPLDVNGNRKLELTWTIIPILLLVVLAIPTISITYNQSPISGEQTHEKGVHIDVTAQQFLWTFKHENGKEVENVLVIPEGKSIYFHLNSKDVIHSFWIPALAGKVDALPGEELTYEIENAEMGTYDGKCAEYCGTQHAKMEFKTKVVSKEQYQQYISKSTQK